MAHDAADGHQQRRAGIPRSSPTDPVISALVELAAGRPVIVADDPDRENEIDFVAAADGISAETVALMVRHGTGLICAAIPAERARHLRLPPQVAENEDYKGTAYTVLCDARWPADGSVHTGISAADRARTLNVIADPAATAADLTRPGHVAPLVARPGGVLERGGHTEAGVDLTRLAGLQPAAAIVELQHDDGTMVRLHEWPAFRLRHRLPDLAVLTISDLIAYRRRTEVLVRHVGVAELPTSQGRFRVHSECRTGDALGSLRCDCRAQLEMALSVIAGEGRGVLVYLGGQEGRGIGLANKIAAYALQDEGTDTYEANRLLGLPEDARDYHAAAHILAHLGMARVRLLTNNVAKQRGLAGYGLEVVARVPLETGVTGENRRYLAAKASAGHALSVLTAPARTA